MLADVKKVLSDFASGLSQALSKSLELVLSFLRIRSSSSQNSDSSSSNRNKSSSTDRNTDMTRELFNQPISKEDVLRSVKNPRNQDTVKMSNQLAQTQKLVDASKQMTEKEQQEKVSSKVPRPR